MRLVSLLLCFGLAACDAAGPGFRGAEKVVRRVEGSAFTLRFRGDMVEAIRTSPEVFPLFQSVARKAAIAAQMETGCHADWIQGDPAMVLIGLACDGRKPPRVPKKRSDLYCDLSEFTVRDGIGSGALTCQRS
ncbi:hypothetical protein [Ponticoccus alexandrii]|uniref:Lipoprotein n=1 Tax=Ponticoccus alexandrii TaxID=1943633 RepID=A0ABX7FD20_9RHOB|nr:hypothetical protein [Ponticoccus alexandrii]QRF67964.1 hypothetical protein GQA70_17630 [Ponticoccus alexandrii]